jgi:signal transduction histidine kinase
MVTERRGVETTAAPVSSSAQELRDALAARDEIIAVFGHELRNAIAPLVLLADQLEVMPVDDLTRAKVAMLARNLMTFVGTLDRVSEISHLREGKLVLEQTMLDAQDVVREVGAELDAMAATAARELRFATTSVVGWWDRERLKQIVKHLVHNAIRHGLGPVDISVRDDGSMLEIVVQDAGPGISPCERERLFDRFERKLLRRSGGLGIGLWVVKQLCQAMGGNVRLADSGRGARFIVALPRG